MQLPESVLVKKQVKTFEKIFSIRADLKLMFELAQKENYKRKGYYDNFYGKAR